MVLAAGLALGGVASAETLPLPDGVGPLPEPSNIELGRTPLEVQGYQVVGDVRTARRFYEETLPRRGWRLTALPWQSQHRDATSRLERFLQHDPEAAADAALAGRLAEMQATLPDLDRQLYAVKGNEHVVVQFFPSDSGRGTTVFINQWQGTPPWERNSALGSPGLGAEPEVCCTGADVPDSGGPLPFGLPRYPGATVLVKTESREADSAEIFLRSDDSPAAIAGFYRAQMGYAGWEPFDDPELRELVGPQGLGFRTRTHLCAVMVDPAGGDDPAGSQTLISLMVLPRPPSLTEQAQ